jgi:hypothetical protein
MKIKSKREEDLEYTKEKILELVEGMVDLEWEIGRMSSSGEETYGKMRKTLSVVHFCVKHMLEVEQKEKKE